MGKITEADIISKIKNGDRQILQQIYKTYKDEFIGWILKVRNVSKNDAEDLFQISVVTFYENIINSKLVELTSSVKSYIFSIGKNKAMELHRLNKKELLFENLPIMDHVDSSDESKESKLFLESRIEQLSLLLDNISERCRKLLKMFYYEKKSMNEIQHEFSFNSSAVAKNEKYKCLSRLKSMAHNG